MLKAAGFELKDVVSITVYLADIHEFPDMNKIYKNVMPDPRPAGATVQAAALVNNARIVISAIAVKQKQVSSQIKVGMLASRGRRQASRLPMTSIGESPWN